MEPILLIDYGSTFTKVTAVDVYKSCLLGSASAYTTIETNVNEGFENALVDLELQTGKLKYQKQLACSSAAGGLRMVAIGLVPDLTAKAAFMATMGAGAKIVGLYSYELTEDDIEEITVISPDILLLTGGTDGGNKKCILHNAEMLVKTHGDFPIIVAGNRSVGKEAMQILANKRVYICENVMPSIGTLNIEPARHLIREIFLERIVHAKGLGVTNGLDDVIGQDITNQLGTTNDSGAANKLNHSVLMPTPAAVLAATELLATSKGDLIAVDVGGATTDVYSIANGTPRGINVIYKGLPEPFAKRTVEGDIGMRYSARGIIEAAGVSKIAKVARIEEASVLEKVNFLTERTDSLPETNEQKSLDFALAASAIETATLRHAGSIEEVYTTSGRAYVQTGKDLTDVKSIIMTGGALIKSDKQTELAEYSMANETQPQSLRPKKAEVFIDNHYILAAMGLLSNYKPTVALEILNKNLKHLSF